MTGMTHISGGILAAELMLAALQPDIRDSSQLLLISWAAVGSILPDIDHATSKISNRNIKLKALAFALQNIFGHRQMIHSPFIGALISLAVYFLSAESVNAGSLPAEVRILLPIFFAAGYLSHLILDSLNPAGILWLWPFKKRRYRMARISPRSAKEWLILCALVIADVGIAMVVLKLPIDFNKYF